MPRDPAAHAATAVLHAPDQPCADCLGEATTPRHPLLATRQLAFWLVAFLFSATMLGTTLPTPLYVIYQVQWHFSAGIVTLIFATYAVGVLLALLLAGRSSDQVGRRPVLAAGLGLSAVSTVVFILTPSLGWLFVGRILSGLSAGLVTGTATAALTELYGGSSSRRASMVATAANMGGLGLGPLIAGLFAQFGPNPTVLVFEVYLGLIALAAISLAVVPETVTDRKKLDLRFTGLGIPAAGRSEFIAAGVAGFAAFSLLGLFTALAPSFLGMVLHEHSHLVSGVVVFAIFGTAAVTQLVLGRFPSRPVIIGGLLLFLVALALIVAALSEAQMGLFLAGTITGGLAVGAVFIASLSTANRLAPVEIRGRAVSTYFVFAYLGLTIPVIAVGIASEHVGDFRAVLVCSIALAVLAAVAMAGTRRAASRRSTRSPGLSTPHAPHRRPALALVPQQHPTGSRGQFGDLVTAAGHPLVGRLTPQIPVVQLLHDDGRLPGAEGLIPPDTGQIQTGNVGVNGEDLRARRQTERFLAVGVPAAIPRLVARIGPVVQQRADVYQRIPERRHIPVEDRVHLIRVCRVKLAVIDLQVVVQYRGPLRRGHSPLKLGRDLLHDRICRLVGHSFPPAAPAAELAGDEPVGPA
jgi:MFS family permease